MTAEQPPSDDPQIYVASLADHHAGRQHGIWLAAVQEPEELQSATEAMLAASREPVAEEWAIHGHDNFKGINIGEFDSFATVARLAVGIRLCGRAFAHFANWRGHDAATIEQFDRSFAGYWATVEDYVSSIVNAPELDARAQRVIPEEFAAYMAFDLSGYARDLRLSGDIYTVVEDSGVFIFERVTDWDVVNSTSTKRDDEE